MKNKKKDQKSQHQNSFLVLRDLKQSGKERPWKKHKKMLRLLSCAYYELSDLTRYGDLLKGCGGELCFEACEIVEHGKKLKRANFCKIRTCPMCQWRKSLVVRSQTLDLVKAHFKEHPTDVPVMLTLTVPNVSGENLNRKIDEMGKGFKRFIKRKVVKNVARSWFKSLEVPRSQERKDWHPHFHTFLMVPDEYFKRSSGLYLERDELLRLWQESMRDVSITQVDIRVMTSKGEGRLESIVAEVAKYATKPSSLVEKDKYGRDYIDPKVLSELHYGLKGRRLIGYGGLFKKIRAERKMLDVEEANLEDLVESVSGEDVYEEGSSKVKACPCKICGGPLVEEVYRWNENIGEYFKIVSSLKNCVDPP
ncbi:MAG: protein rep [Bacteriovorax sp.]|jgi:plasmid rolling circle replication initiator protein Rep|nr:protein rep [Bacteriovorax sp.]